MANQTEGRPTNREADFAAYELLPADLRRLLQRAPYNFRAESFLELQRGLNLGAARSYFIEMVLRQRDHCIAQAYGKDHPMIGQRTSSRI
jgi:hypothetical protein